MSIEWLRIIPCLACFSFAVLAQGELVVQQAAYQHSIDKNRTGVTYEHILYPSSKAPID